MPVAVRIRVRDKVTVRIRVRVNVRDRVRIRIRVMFSVRTGCPQAAIYLHSAQEKSKRVSYIMYTYTYNPKLKNLKNLRINIMGTAHKGRPKICFGAIMLELL